MVNYNCSNKFSKLMKQAEERGGWNHENKSKISLKRVDYFKEQKGQHDLIIMSI